MKSKINFVWFNWKIFLTVNHPNSLSDASCEEAALACNGVKPCEKQGSCCLHLYVGGGGVYGISKMVGGRFETKA